MKDRTCFREFLKYVSLNVLGMLGLSCYILADTFFVSKGLGTNGLTALNLSIPVYSFISGSGLMLGMGGATKYTILRSRGDASGANRVFTAAMLLAAGLSAVFLLTGLFFSAPLAKALGADESVFLMSKTYLRVILLFAPVFMLNNVLLCFVRNDGAPQLSMLAMTGGSLSNILLDFVFIFPCKMGIFGAAFATGLAPVISMAILSVFFFRRKNTFHPSIGGLSGKLAAGILSGGLPSLITEVSSGVVMIVFNVIILGLQGNTGVAAYGIIANLSLVVVAVYTGIAQGIQPLISRDYGTGNDANGKAVLRYGLLSMLLLSLLLYACIFFGAFQIVNVFNSERDPLLESIAAAGLKIYFTGCAFAGFNIILPIYFTSTENPRPAHIISTLRGFFIVVPLAFFLSSLAGMTGVWLVFPVTELLVGAAGIVLYILAKKRTPKERGFAGERF